MSWTDSEISEMAKKAEADHAFTYQDSFWSEMEAMLPAKKKRFWPYFLAIAIPLVGTSALWFGWPTTVESFSQVAKTNTAGTNATHVLTSATNLDDQIAINNTNTIENTNIGADGNKALSVSNNEDVTSQTLARKSIVNDLNIENKQEAKSTSLTQSNASKINAVSKSALDETKVDDANEIRNDIATNVELETPITTNSAEVSTQESAPTAPTAALTRSNVDKLKMTPISTLYINQDTKIAALPYYSRRRYFSAFGELGYGIGETYATDQIGHTEFASIAMGARLTKNKLFVQAGIGFEVEKAKLELSQREKIYSYSVNTYENRMSYKQMYRVNLPVNFGYQINKHVLQFGAAASYLMSTKMNYAYLENENVKRNETIYGTKTGWNSFGLRVNVGYGFNILPSTTLGANFRVQLMNQLDTRWTPNENKMPISGQVFIRKTLR